MTGWLLKIANSQSKALCHLPGQGTRAKKKKEWESQVEELVSMQHQISFSLLALSLQQGHNNWSKTCTWTEIKTEGRAPLSSACSDTHLCLAEWTQSFAPYKPHGAVSTIFWWRKPWHFTVCGDGAEDNSALQSGDQGQKEHVVTPGVLLTTR